MNLYIIGNGFDLMHNLPTKYFNYAKFCLECDHELYYNMEKCFPKLNIGGLWANFENALGFPDEEYMLQNIKKNEQTQRDGEICIDISRLRMTFGKWVKTLNNLIDVVADIKIDRYFDLNNSDMFLTFNYTNVLEKIYKIDSKRIIHIHGGGKELYDIQKSDICYSGYIFGHGEEISTVPHLIENHEHLIREERKSLKKDVQIKRLKQDIDNKLGMDNIDNIIVIGHSMAKVDYDYFKFINGRFPEAHWTIYYHGISDKSHKIKHILECGIKNSCLISDK